MKRIILLVVAFALTMLLATTSVFASTSYLSIDMPDDFLWSGPTVNIFKNSEGYYTDVNIEDYKVVVASGVDVYVDVALGDDTTGTGAEGTPYKSITKALAEANVENIYVAAGWYSVVEGFKNTTVTGAEVNIIGVGDVYLTGFAATSGYSFALTTSRDYTYEYAIGFPQNAREVFDKTTTDIYGGYLKYTEVESINDVDLTPGSWYEDGTNIYIHTFDGRVPDADVIIDFIGRPAYFISSTVYLENLNFYGGINALTAEDSTIYLNDVEVMYSQMNGLYSDNSDVIANDVIAAHNTGDGLGYVNGNVTSEPWVIEINADLFANGVGADDDINNGSTLHQNYVAIRINGEYSYNKGPNIHDIDSSQSIIYGSTAHHSIANTDLRNTNFRIDETTALNMMWLYDVISYGSVNDYQSALETDYRDSDQLFVSGYIVESSVVDDTTTVATITAPDETLLFLGLEWYWWTAIAVGAYGLFGTKKGRKAIGLK